MNRVYNDYNAFAYFYNKYWTKMTPTLMQEALSLVLFPELKSKAEILDICCGTGDNALMMSVLGYKVTGVDGSDEMLDFARSKATDADFFCCDARYFNLEKKFDAVTSLFDSVNHMLSIDDVEMVFTNAYNHLNDGGIFVFDVNSEQSSIDAADSSFSSVKEDHVFVLSADYDRNTRLINYAMTMFNKDNKGKWLRRDASIRERYYTEAEIIKTLSASGFKNIQMVDGAEDLDIEAFEGRLFFSCRR